MSAVALSQQVSRDIAKEQLILDHLAAIKPEAVEDFKAATIAMDADKFEEAIALYEKVYKAVPEFDPVIRRLGICYASKGEIPRGLELLEAAVKIKRSPENLISLARFLAFPAPHSLVNDLQKERAYQLASEADRLPKSGDDSDYQVILAELSLTLGRDAAYREITAKLVRTHPELVQTHYYNAILLAYDEEWIKAEDEVRKAESLGLTHDIAQKMLDHEIHTQASIRRYVWYALYLVVLWIVGLVALFVVGKLMSWVTIRSLERANPNLITSRSELFLRKWYRLLVNLGGIYYYLSIPFVIFLVLGVAGGATYGALMVGRLPIKLLVVLWICAIVTVFKLIQCLFIKVKREDPGRPLRYEEAPKLWELTRSVAVALGTRPVDEIRVTPGTDLAVYENGTWRERSRDQARRVLILGVGVLNDFRLSGFRAVLAHEYGHFSHRDTAGGDVALRVNSDMMKFAYAMTAAGQNVWLNLGFQFLRIYHFIFRRLSYGATRMQEVLADRVAALKYGSAAFEEGLRHVILKSAQFTIIANQEINASVGGERALQNLYEIPFSAAPGAYIEAKENLDRPTSEDDTHPSPRERFRLTRKVFSQSEPPISGMVWDLFQDRAALTLEMTSTIQARLDG